MNYLFLFIEMVVMFGLLVLAKRLLGKPGIYSMIAAATIFANIFEAKNITLFGLSLGAGHVMFGAVFLATDILNECYGKEEAKKGVFVGLLADIALILAGMICRAYVPSEADTVNGAIQTLFSMSLRITIASAVMYFIANWFDVIIYAKIRNLTGGRFIWLRNNVATILCNCLENFAFYFMAFYGVFDTAQIISMSCATCILEVVISLCDTPFLYLATKVK